MDIFDVTIFIKSLQLKVWYCSKKSCLLVWTNYLNFRIFMHGKNLKNISNVTKVQVDKWHISCSVGRKNWFWSPRMLGSSWRIVYNHFSNLIFWPYAWVTWNPDYRDNPTREQCLIKALKRDPQLGFWVLILFLMIINNEHISTIYTDISSQKRDKGLK